jgi:DNA-binding transcriptional LysR family regulator
MEWQQILGFYHAAKLASFTRAADATFRTQSALSQQIKALEEELDCQLFERIGKRRLRLTAAGERLLRFSETVLEGYEQLKGELSELQGLPKGRLRIAAPFTTLYHLFPQALRAYIERFPHVELTVLDRPQQSVFDLVRNGDIDFGLALESEIPADLAKLRWKRVETVVIVPADHPLTKSAAVSLAQIARYPLILPPKDLKLSFRKILEERLQELQITYHVILESSNVELSSHYVEMGFGICFATVAKELPALVSRKLNFIPVSDLSQVDHIALVMRRDKSLPSYRNAFVELLLDHRPTA